MLQEANKDAAEEAMRKAEEYILKEDWPNALKKAKQAHKMYPSVEAAAVLERAQPPYSQQQMVAVSKVMECTDYYGVLGVTRDAPDSDVRRAYKKLALMLHPDKNRAPGADVAFKKVGAAAGVLLDAEKRKMYDMHGSEERPRYPTATHTRTFETEFSAEEFFNLFFNNGPQNVYARRTNASRYQREHYQQREPQGNNATILQMLPILGLILLSTVSTLFISDPIYSLTQSSKFSVPRKTENLAVPYWVKENFHNEYQGSLRRLELSVEEDYIVNLRMACQRERAYRDNMAWKARHVSSSQFQNVNNIKMPSCEALSNLHS